jgi:hypothetical protein
MDILIALRGKPGSGQKDVADIGIEKFNCTGKTAILDWQKKLLSDEFGVSLELLNSEEPVVLDRPFAVKPSNIRRLLMKLGEYGFSNINRVSTGKWNGRYIATTEDMINWFSKEFVLAICGDMFVGEVTKNLGIKPIVRKEDQTYDVIFVTDVETDAQINALKHGISLFFVVSVDKTDTNALAFESIVNDGSLVDLELKVRDMLLKVQEEVKRVRSNQQA